MAHLEDTKEPWKVLEQKTDVKKAVSPVFSARFRMGVFK